eukprot:g17569.t1
MERALAPPGTREVLFKRARLPFGLNWAQAPTTADSGWCAAEVRRVLARGVRQKAEGGAMTGPGEPAGGKNGWVIETTNDGRDYYYHTVTGKCQWHMPDELGNLTVEERRKRRQ